ncbi:MAG TPA: hypothetical protein PK185_04655 [Cyclobacteriaceae bacterium]|nr:hypothetical protein [Cyclobacteriaceae bacterium]HRK53182.1 hypothetical protein [Cyclobacteriaceae bacterium]
MKNIFKSGFLSLALMLIISACGDEPYDVADGGSLGAIMAPVTDVTFLGGISTGVDVALNKFANEGVTVTAVNVTKQLLTTGGNSDPVKYAITGDTFTQTVSELYADVPVGGVVQSNSTLTPGDKWELSYSMSLADGRTMAIGTKTKITFLCAPYPGVWTIEMHDSFGDGWQTNDGNGGNGIQITLNKTTVLEVGLCSPYQPSPFTCTPGVSNGTATITIPNGTQEASWFFPGDRWGEISFEIYGPTGALVFASGAPGAQGAGILPVILCAP